MKPLAIIAVVAAAALALAGVAGILLAPWVGPLFTSEVWQVEPLSHVGLVLFVLGLGLALATVLAVFLRLRRAGARRQAAASQVIDVLTHDLKRPIAEIQGMVRFLEGPMLDQLSAEQLRKQLRCLVGEIETQTANFKLTMDNARVLADMDDPSAYLPFEPVNVPAIIEDILARYRYRAAMAGVEILLVPPAQRDPCRMVYSNGGAISQIIANLVDNALRYANTQVHIQTGPGADNSVCIQVRDDGTGILTSYREHVYDKGWTPEVSEGRDRKSSGMGLYISLELARRCGGAITLESRAADDPGASGPTYTAFTLTLPHRPPGGTE